jgi:hypothetical protein
MLPVVLTDIGLLTAFTGLLSLVRPLTAVGISNRFWAAGIVVAGVLIAVGASRLPASETIVGSPETMLDRVTPAYQFHEVHSVTIRATPERVYRAIKEVTPDEILFFHTLISIRQLGRPLPENIRNLPEHLPLLDIMTRTTFVLLADTGQEIVVGTAVHTPPGAGRPRTAEEFLALRSHAGFALASMNLAVRQSDDGASVVSTETRVYGTDAPTRRRFGIYWRIIYPGSALLRRMWLRAIKQRAEAA